jgi:hypothetical protein
MQHSVVLKTPPIGGLVLRRAGRAELAGQAEAAE